MKRIYLVLLAGILSSPVKLLADHANSGQGERKVRLVSEVKESAPDPDEILWEVAKKDARVGIHHGIRDPKVCEQAKKHSDWLAAQMLPERLYKRSIAHHGDGKRSAALIGNLVGSRGFRANTFQEIVTETLPTDDVEKAARECIDHWFQSDDHRPVLVNKTAKWSCLSMTRSKNPNNSRWYCMGIALYYQ